MCGTGYENSNCERQIEMTFPEDFSGGIRGDGTADERWELPRLAVLRDLDQQRLTTTAAAQFVEDLLGDRVPGQPEPLHQGS